MEQISSSKYHVLVRLIEDAGVDGPLGPFAEADARVGMNVIYQGATYSAFLVIGRREVRRGDTIETVLLVSQKIPNLRGGDVVALSTGIRTVGTAEVL